MRLWRNQAFVVFWSARYDLVRQHRDHDGRPAGAGIRNDPLARMGGRAGPDRVRALSRFRTAAGVVADRMNRKKIMVGCDVIAAFLLAAIPAAAALHLLGTAQVLIVALGIATVYCG